MTSAKELPQYTARVERPTIVVDAVAQYRKDLKSIPELRKREEIFLAQQIERGRVAKTIFSLTYRQKESPHDTSNLPLVGQKGCADIKQESALQYLQELGLSEEEVEVVTKETAANINNIKPEYVAGQKELFVKQVKTVESLRIKDPDSIKKKVGVQILEILIQQATEARQKIFLSNLKLVVKIAGKHANRQNFLDVIQEGNLAMSNVLDKYEWWQQNSFSTYAWYSIDGHIRNYIKEHKSLIRVPPAVIGRFNITKVLTRKAELQQLTGAEPTLEELAKATGIPIEKLGEIISLTKTIYSIESLDMPLIDREGKEYDISEHLVVAIPEESVEEQVERKIKIAAVRDALAEVLTEREIKVLQLRFGLELTQEEITKEMGVTRERVGQIERKALRKLQEPNNRKKLEDWI